MAFIIKIPFVTASHVKKFAASSSLKNKSKAGALGFVGNVLYGNSGTTAGAIPVGGDVQFTPSGAATVTILANQSGMTFAWDLATGVTYTLPTPQVGLHFWFITTVLQTSGADAVKAAGAGVFVNGSIVMFSGENVTPSATLGPKQFAGNGTTHIQLTQNGTTTGGGVGTWVHAVCVSSTIWNITGVVNSPSGSLATPFTT